MGKHGTVRVPEDSATQQGTDTTVGESSDAELVPHEAPIRDLCSRGAESAGCGPVDLLQ